MKRVLLLLVCVSACNPILSDLSQPLLAAEDEAPGDNCAEGGVAIFTGLDRNENGTLDADERTGDARYVCAGESLTGNANLQGGAGPTGANGADGVNGTNGADGATGTNGNDGAPGSTGSTGAAGPTGEAGVTGASGQPGPGSPGTSQQFSLAPVSVPGVPDGAVVSFGANGASVTTTPGGLLVSTSSTPGVYAAGAFNGAGVGNKGFVGLPGFGLGRVDAFQSFHMEGTVLVGPTGLNQLLYLNVLVDGNHDGAFTPPAQSPFDPATDCVMVIDFSPSQTGAFSIDVTPTTPVYGSVGGASDHACNLPNHFGAPLSVLGDLLSAFPDAIFFSGYTGDGGMPRNTPMPAWSLIVGDTGNQTVRKIEVHSVELQTTSGTTAYDFTP